MGERVRAAPDTLTDAQTDLSQVFLYARETYPSELLGGIVLATDGIYNRGTDPVYAAAALQAPVYALGVGDTTLTRDVAIRDVLYNRIAYLGDKLEMRVELAATNASGAGTTVSVEAVGEDGRTRTLAQERVTFSGERAYRSVAFTVEPAREGVQRYRVRASSVADERNRANNAREVYVDVLDRRQRVAIVAAAPHPDVAAIRKALEGTLNYELDFALIGDLRLDSEPYDLYVLHALPSGLPGEDALLRRIRAEGAGTWVVTGAGRRTAAASEAIDLLGIDLRGGQVNAASPQLKGTFDLFTAGDRWGEVVAQLPPATAPFAEYGPLAAGDVLLTQRLGRVQTDYPLLAMGDVNGRKQAVFVGQGLWRWRLAEFQREGSHEVVDGIINATTQYLALREDRSPFRVSASERVYTTSDDVRLQAELYNASFQRVNDPDVAVVVTEADGTDYRFLMDRVGEGYQLRAGRLPAGSYRFEAATEFAGETYRDAGAFTVRQLELESLVTTANWAGLRRLAAQQGGRFFGSQDLEGLADELLGAPTARPVLYESVRTRPLIDWPWLLAISLALLSVEWLVRRRLGTY